MRIAFDCKLGTMEALIVREEIFKYLRRIIKSFLSDRSKDVRDGQVIEVTSKVLQGTVLEPPYDRILHLKLHKKGYMPMT